jgi:hypothetical protein
MTPHKGPSPTRRETRRWTQAGSDIGITGVSTYVTLNLFTKYINHLGRVSHSRGGVGWMLAG